MTAEPVDCCSGHVSDDGCYNYVHLPYGDTCENPVFDISNQEAPQFIGIAFDGFPIYGQWDGLDPDTLDECHGTRLPNDGRYAYIAVKNHFPYIMGCYMGTPIFENRRRCTDGRLTITMLQVTPVAKTYKTTSM